MVSPFDPIDTELLAFLSQDGRMKLTELGKRLEYLKGTSMSHVSVQKRIQKMISDEFLKIQATINISKLSFVSSFILIETGEIEAQRRIIERFRVCPRVLSIDLLSGKYNIIMRAWAETLQELESFLNYCWLKQERGIRNLEILISSTNIKPHYFPMQFINEERKQKFNAPCGHRCALCDRHQVGACSGCPAISPSSFEITN